MIVDWHTHTHPNSNDNFTTFQAWQAIGEDKTSQLLDLNAFTDARILAAVEAWLK